jgi:hypothetical protein
VLALASGETISVVFLSVLSLLRRPQESFADEFIQLLVTLFRSRLDLTLLHQLVNLLLNSVEGLTQYVRISGEVEAKP